MNKNNNKNNNIIYEFVKLIEYYKSINENIFRINALKEGLKKIIDYPSKIKHSKDLIDYYGEKQGIGTGILDRVDYILKYGSLNTPKLSKLINRLSNIVGLSISKASKLIKKYKLTTFNQFVKLVKSKKIILNQASQISLKYMKQTKYKIKRNLIDEFKHKITPILTNFEIAGSYRRKKKYSGDIDLLIFSTKPLLFYINKLQEKFNLVKISLGSTKFMGLIKLKKFYYQIDIRVINPKSKYSALLYFTGSATFNKYIRLLCKNMNYKLNEYYLLKNNKKYYLKNEKEIFKILNIKYLKPEERS